MPSREMHWGRFRNIYSGTDTLDTQMMLRHRNVVLNPNVRDGRKGSSGSASEEAFARRQDNVRLTTWPHLNSGS
jgi:hypothetical protein